MILVFEPQCRGFAHEQFNAGFLYGYLLAYPDEKIVLWAEKEHVKCIQSVFDSAELSFTRIEFHVVEIPQPDRLQAFFAYSKILKELLAYAHKNRCDRIVLLSTHTYNLIPLKYLLQYKYRNSVRVHIAMHGIIESIKRSNFPSLFNIYRKIAARMGKILGLPNSELKHEPLNQYFYERLFKLSLHLFSNDNITYFVFHEDSLEKLKKYLPRIQKYFKSLDLPYIYKTAMNATDKDFSNLTIFATFDKGYVRELSNITSTLGQSSTSANDFEVRIIGGSLNEDLSHFEKIKHIVKNRKFSREEIDQVIKDAHYVLLFYPPDSYELTSSGIFFDAIAYCKPVIFLKNYCLDFYYSRYKFGYRCESINDMTAVMKKIILGELENYEYLIDEIKHMQQDVAIRNNFHKLLFSEAKN